MNKQPPIAFPSDIQSSIARLQRCLLEHNTFTANLQAQSILTRIYHCGLMSQFLPWFRREFGQAVDIDGILEELKFDMESGW